MKTSNKILLGLLIVAFVVPVFLFMAIGNAVKKGNYTVQKVNNNEQWRKVYKELKHFRVVKVMTAPGRALKVSFKASDSLAYSYNRVYEDDSIRFTHSGDTLLINHYYKIHKDENGMSTATSIIHLHVTVYLPHMENLIVDNADVTIHSGASDSLNIKITGTGIVYLGGLLEVGTDHDNREYTQLTPVAMAIDNVNVLTAGGEMLFASQTSIKDLNLQIKGNSRLVFNEGGKIDKVSGSISGNSYLSANASTLKRLAALTE